MLKGSEPTKFDNWVCVMERGTEYEIQLAHNYLQNLEIPSNILSKRDSSYSLNFGEMSMVYLYVPKEFEKEARNAIREFLDSTPESTDTTSAPADVTQEPTDNPDPKDSAESTDSSEAEETDDVGEEEDNI